MRLDINTIRDAAVRVYRRHFGDGAIEGVLADEFIDSSGDEAIKVVVVAKQGQMDTLLGGLLGDAAHDLQDELTSAGEDHFAYIGYGEVGDVQVDEEDDFGVAGVTLGRP